MYFRRWAAAFSWAYLTWTVLSWTRSVEQIAVGVVLSALTAAACVPLGPLAGPWRVLRPARLAGLARLGGDVLLRMVRANIGLSRRIWTRSLPVPSGMVLVATSARSDGEYAAVGLLTSVIVDCQLVDVDRARGELQYHVVSADGADPEVNRRRINGPVEAGLARVTGR